MSEEGGLLLSEEGSVGGVRVHDSCFHTGLFSPNNSSTDISLLPLLPSPFIPSFLPSLVSQSVGLWEVLSPPALHLTALLWSKNEQAYFAADMHSDWSPHTLSPIGGTTH